MFINVDDRLNHALSKELEPGEEVIASAFGLHTVSRETARWILFLGLFVLGLLLLGVLNDKVFVVLTNRRLLIIKLTTKGLYRCGRMSLDMSEITRVRREKGTLFHDVEFNCHGQYYRFKFSEHVINFRNSGERAVQLADALATLAEGRTSVPAPDPQSGLYDVDNLVVDESQEDVSFQAGNALVAVLKAERPQRLPFFWPLLKSTLLAVPGGFVAMCIVFLVAAMCIPDIDNASQATLLAVAFFAFVLPFLGTLGIVIWSVRRSRAKAMATKLEQRAIAETSFERILSEAQPAG